MIGVLVDGQDLTIVPLQLITGIKTEEVRYENPDSGSTPELVAQRVHAANLCLGDERERRRP
jgi:hypothetical protein